MYLIDIREIDDKDGSLEGAKAETDNTTTRSLHYLASLKMNGNAFQLINMLILQAAQQTSCPFTGIRKIENNVTCTYLAAAEEYTNFAQLIQWLIEVSVYSGAYRKQEHYKQEMKTS